MGGGSGSSATSASRGPMGTSVAANATKYMFVTSRPSTPVQVLKQLVSLTFHNNELLPHLVLYSAAVISSGKVSSTSPDQTKCLGDKSRKIRGGSDIWKQPHSSRKYFSYNNAPSLTNFFHHRAMDKEQ